MILRLTLIFLLFAQMSFGQIVINEFSASNLRDYTDDYDKGEDWIELYNNSEVSIDISNYYLSDKLTKPKKWQIPSGTKIEAKSFLTVWASGRDITQGPNLHTNFRLTQTSGDEYVVLSNANGVVIESFLVPITLLSHSMGKSEDGGNKWRIFTSPSFNASNNDVPSFTSYSSIPTLDKKAGFYTDAVTVQIGNNNGMVSRYTLDGSLPSDSSALVTGPITIDQTAVLKVRNFSLDNNVLPGKIAFATYFINEPTTTLPIVSVASELAIQLAEGNRDLKPYSSFELFTNDGKLITTSYGELDSHGQDSWVNPQRSLDWISRDEMGYNSGVEAKIFHYSDREDFQRIILRASGDDNYPSIQDADHEGSTHVRDEYVHTLVQKGGMKMDVRAVERAIVYINGQYWGVYTLREKPDDTDYTEHTYNQDKFNVQFLKTWGRSWAEYGGQQGFNDWAKLRDFILNNDMSIKENYEAVLEEYNVTSLMDYMIANLSVVSTDWLNYNTGWWRGLNPKGDHKKWGYVMWDNDATFDYYINYSGVPNDNPDAKACDINQISEYMDEFFPKDSMFIKFPGDSIFIDGMWQYFPPDSFWVSPDPGKHEKIFLKLLAENENFRTQYYTRYADMISTTFSCENMIHTLDSLIAIIEPEMPNQVKRWGGTLTEWQKNVGKLRTFISERCTKIADGLVECYNDLSGPFAITLLTDPPSSGQVKLNSLMHTQFPWSGQYFGKIDNLLEASSGLNWKFKKWISTNGNTVFKDGEATLTQAVISSSDTLIAVFESTISSTDDLSATSIYISPNPAHQSINVQLEKSCLDCQYTIIDNLGRISKRGVMESTEIGVTELPSGMYTIKISNKANGVMIGKFMVVQE